MARMRGITAVATLLIGVGALTACANGGSTTTPANSTAGDGSTAAVTTIKQGVLTVGISPDFPPMEYLEGQNLVGSDVEMITEVAKRLGLTVEFDQQKFDQLINSVRTDRVDLVISGMSDTVERQKTLDFVDYYNSLGRFYTLSDKASKFSTAGDVCGVAVAVSSKTDYYPALQQFSKDTCESAGKPAVNIVQTDSGAAARLQLEQGRAELAVQGAENLAYFEKTDAGKYEIVLDALTDQPFAIGVRKGNMQLAEAVRDKLEAMYDDGTAEDILTKHGIPDGLRAPAINEVKE